MSSNPIIGIAANILLDRKKLNWHNYANNEQDIDSIFQAGGYPLIIPPIYTSEHIQILFEHLDGLYLAGGGDIDGAFWGEAGNPLIQNINKQRDEIELLLAQMARQHALPILGICRGCQILNVAAGGSLVVDISSETPVALQHDPHKHQDFVSHSVILTAGTKLAHIYDTHILTVNSFHHQAVKTPGAGLVISARSPDGIVEGIEADDHPFYLGVQWHPERESGNQADISKIFTAFINAAKQNTG